jgi:hypothetical protein
MFGKFGKMPLRMQCLRPLLESSSDAKRHNSLLGQWSGAIAPPWGAHCRGEPECSDQDWSGYLADESLGEGGGYMPKSLAIGGPGRLRGHL